MTKAVTAEQRVAAVRTKLAKRFISGCGLEVGAGSRPFPVPAHAEVVYGDIRERAALESYFKTRAVSSGQRINAQTLAGIADNSVDFVISAHVIEHLLDPIGAIVSAIRVVKRGGVHILVVPDMRRTFDRHRPETTVAHAIADFRDRGLGTCKAGYEEHLRYVHPVLTGQHYPQAEIQRQAAEAARLWPKYGAHFHAWTRAGFDALLRATYEFAPFRIITAMSVANENLFVLRKISATAFRIRLIWRKSPLNIAPHGSESDFRRGRRKSASVLTLARQ